MSASIKFKYKLYTNPIELDTWICTCTFQIV